MLVQNEALTSARHLSSLSSQGPDTHTFPPTQRRVMLPNASAKPELLRPGVLSSSSPFGTGREGVCSSGFQRPTASSERSSNPAGLRPGACDGLDVAKVGLVKFGSARRHPGSRKSAPSNVALRTSSPAKGNLCFTSWLISAPFNGRYKRGQRARLAPPASTNQGPRSYP